MQVVKKWLGWPESTKEKTEALRKRDAELNDRIRQQFDELEELLTRKNSNSA